MGRAGVGARTTIPCCRHKNFDARTERNGSDNWNNHSINWIEQCRVGDLYLGGGRTMRKCGPSRYRWLKGGLKLRRLALDLGNRNVNHAAQTHSKLCNRRRNSSTLLHRPSCLSFFLQMTARRGAERHLENKSSQLERSSPVQQP